jgi:ligand-binding SRPBCC domain-containing protein
LRIFEFRRELCVPAAREKVFEFFSDALNLERITPSWLQFRGITPAPIHMIAGAEIEYRLKIRGIPAKWKSRITVWEPTNRFVDEQIAGPYRVWIHEHRFADDPRGTICSDHVRYAPPGGVILNALIVGRDIRKIFAYRTERLREIFGRCAE